MHVQFASFLSPLIRVEFEHLIYLFISFFLSSALMVPLGSKAPTFYALLELLSMCCGNVRGIRHTYPFCTGVSFVLSDHTWYEFFIIPRGTRLLQTKQTKP